MKSVSVAVMAMLVGFACGSGGGGVGGGGGHVGNGGGVGGNGAGAGNGGSLDVPFSFADRQPNQTVTLQGFTAPIVNDDGDVTLGAHTGVSVALAYDGNRNSKSIHITAPHGSASFDRLSCVGFWCNTDSTGLDFSVVGARDVMFLDPVHETVFEDWNYQTYGVWAKRASPARLEGGSFSVGTPTPASAIPTVGSAVFTGSANGLYDNGSFTSPAFFVGANMRAEVNFGTRQVEFSTSLTSMTPFPGGEQWVRPDLDLRGSYSYAPGSSSFSGPVRTVDNANTMNGSLSGQFYGPNAQEIGGVYSLSGRGGERMVGGFGGQR